MYTKVIKIDQQNIDRQKILEAAEWIWKKELVAFPTETVYGLGANGLEPEASAKIYAAKGRPSDNPLILHISRIKDILPLTKDVPETAMKAMRAFWPGPMTVVLKKSEIVPVETTGGLSTVAIRMPNHPIALAFIEASGCPIAAPSANTSGRPSPTKAEHVLEDMDGKIPCIVDGGMVGIGIESTIVDFSEEKPMILRPGFITPRMLEQVIGIPVEIDPAVLKGSRTKELIPKAPGMKYKHYAPKADLILISGKEENVISYINHKIDEQHRLGKRVGVIATDETSSQYKGDKVMSIGTKDCDSTIAFHLYDVLRKFDHEDVSVIYSQVFETGENGLAIMNRLTKAAGYERIEV